MKCFLAVIAALSTQCIHLCADTVYYETATGNKFENRSWHAMDRGEFESKQPDDVYDFYTFERLADGSSRVHRQIDAPSGDWLFIFTYHYGPKGRLSQIDWEFRTFNGIDVEHNEEGLTRCLRTYRVKDSGELRLLSERMEDVNTGRPVTRSFYEPKITHWLTLKDLPIEPKT